MRFERRVAAGWCAVGGTLLLAAAADQLRIGRLAKDDPGFGPLLAQDAADARDRAAGAIAGDEIIKPRSREVGDDFARGRRLVDVGVGFGLELTGEEPAICLGKLDGLAVHAEALLGARRQHHLGSENPHQLAPLDGETVRHGHDQGISLLGTDHGKTDAGIAAGRLDDGLSGFSVPLRSAASMMLTASRSFTEAAGLKNSALT